MKCFQCADQPSLGPNGTKPPCQHPKDSKMIFIKTPCYNRTKLPPFNSRVSDQHFFPADLFEVTVSSDRSRHWHQIYSTSLTLSSSSTVGIGSSSFKSSSSPSSKLVSSGISASAAAEEASSANSASARVLPPPQFATMPK